jgi:cytochrome o ubiquinol oxidase operon protein cyoD
MSHPGHASEHGSTKSYVIGFVLSLVFTLIPYYLVVNHSLTSTGLLWTILSFGIIQMIIQITFFLHLGRGPKPNWNLYFFAGTVGIILVVVGGTIVIIHNLHYNMSPADQTKFLVDQESIYQVNGKETGACQQLHANHKITIKNGQVSPVHTSAKRCDTLSFIDGDNGARVVGFGTNLSKMVYDGETELIVQKIQNKTITLSQSGTYSFYDVAQTQINGDFTVSP